MGRGQDAKSLPDPDGPELSTGPLPLLKQTGLLFSSEAGKPGAGRTPGKGRGLLLDPSDRGIRGHGPVEGRDADPRAWV